MVTIASRTVAILDDGTEIVLKPHHVAVVLWLDDRRVNAIRFITAEYKLGLRNAKDVCDAILANRPQGF